MSKTSQITTKAAARIMSATAKKSISGTVSKGSFAARAQRNLTKKSAK